MHLQRSRQYPGYDSLESTRRFDTCMKCAAVECTLVSYRRVTLQKSVQEKSRQVWPRWLRGVALHSSVSLALLNTPHYTSTTHYNTLHYTLLTTIHYTIHYSLQYTTVALLSGTSLKCLPHMTVSGHLRNRLLYCTPLL